MSYFDDMLAFVAEMASIWPDQSPVIPTLCRNLSRLAKRHETICVHECNGEGDTATLTKRSASIEKAINALGEEWGFRAEFSGDPRGATVKLILPNGKKNDWGQVGYCVPVRS